MTLVEFVQVHLPFPPRCLIDPSLLLAGLESLLQQAGVTFLIVHFPLEGQEFCYHLLLLP